MHPICFAADRRGLEVRGDGAGSAVPAHLLLRVLHRHRADPAPSADTLRRSQTDRPAVSSCQSECPSLTNDKYLKALEE